MNASQHAQKEFEAVSVLVIDDEEPVRRFMTRLLSDAGCAVRTASHGREGLNMVLNHDFDVVVVDMRMQEMDGLAFLQETRKIWPWLGLVIATAYPEDESIQKALQLGVRIILQKPVTKEQLLDAVIDEARLKKQHDQQPRGLPMEKFQLQMAVLRKLGESAVAHENPADALRDFSDGLSKSFPCSAAGMLDLEADARLLILTVREPVAEKFLERMKQEMMERYQALSGKPLTEASLRIQVEGLARSPSGPDTPASTVIVPLMIAGELHGLIMLSSYRPSAFSWMETSFLYQAANQFSTVRLSLNRMRQLAIHDPLTGLYNRRHLEEDLDQAWQMATRYDHDVSVAILDIDEFKLVNDKHGHQAGDQVLAELARVLRSTARTSDIVGRYGGDEFIVVLPKAGSKAAKTFGQRLHRAFRGHVFCKDSLNLRLTISVGIASRRSNDPPVTFTDLVRQADEALLAAKRSGRNHVAIWPPGVESSVKHQKESKSGKAVDSPSAEAGRGRVLVVDDERSICIVLSRMLEIEHFEVATESTSAGALDALTKRPNEFDVVMTDLKLASESGIELLHRIEALDPTIIKIVITGHATVDNAIESLRSGAYDFVEKPIARDKLMAVLDRALKLRQLQRENVRYKLFLEDMVRQKSASLSQALDEIRQSYEFTLEALVAMLDAREHDTGRHSMRVRDLALLLARDMGRSQEELEIIGHGALLHDIGKIAIPDGILLKEGPLSDLEWEIMRTHPEIGFKILNASAYLKPAAEIVLSHHERFDGSGYPRHLKGRDICLGARIFAVVDAYDTMRSLRCYKKAYSMDHATGELKQNRGTQFDPDIVDSFLRCQDRLERLGAWVP